MKQKKSYKSVPAAAVVKEYRLAIIGIWILHILTVPAAAFLIWRGISGQTILVNGIFEAIVALFANYLIRVLKTLKLNQVNRILTFDCDPVKYEAIFRPIRDGGWKAPVYTLNIARALYYQGNWEDAKKELEKISMKPGKSLFYLQCQNLMVSCLESEGDLNRIIKIREQVKKQVASAKEKSNFAANGRQLLNIIDGALAFRRKNVTRAREIYEDLYDNATFTLSRITALWKLAQLDQLTGANYTASDRCDYIIDAGGTTFYVKEAEALLDRCCKRAPKPESEPESEEEVEDGAE